MGFHHAKLGVFLITLQIFFTCVCRGEFIPTIDEEYLQLNDYGENGIQGVSGEDEKNQVGFSLDRLRALLGMQPSLRTGAGAPSPYAESPYYDNGDNNNNNDGNTIPFLPLGPPITTPPPPNLEYSSPAFSFNSPYPENTKKHSKWQAIVVSVVMTAAVTLAVAGLLLYYMHWRFVGNGHTLEEQPRSERGLLNSSVSEGSDFFKGLHPSELGILHEESDLAYSFNRDKFERVTFPTYLENNGTTGSPEVQAISLSRKPTYLTSLEFPSDDDSYHSTCETPSSDSKRRSRSRLPAWELPSSHSSPVSSSSSSPISSPVKSSTPQIVASSVIPPPTKQHPSKSPIPPIPSRSLPPPPAVSARSPPVQSQRTRDIPSSQEAKQPCAFARGSQSSIPPLPPHPPPSFLRTGQNPNQSGPGKRMQRFSATGRNETETPLPKLKPLYWDKVRAPPERTMVWNRLRSGSFELDEEMIESLFGCNTTNNTTNTVKNEATKSLVVPPAAKNQHILDPKKSQNIAIILRALSVTREEVCDALLQGNGLTTELLETLVKMAPTREEEARLKEYNGDVSKLGPGERFIKALLDIPFAFQRVDAMLYRANFEEEVASIQKLLETLELACKELRCSRLFFKLLEAVLKTGNRMNVGTFRGEAQAFKLDALLKLADIKGIDGKTTVLHFVVQEIIRAEGMQSAERSNGSNGRACPTGSDITVLEDKEDDYRKLGLQLISGLSTELCNVKMAAGIDSHALISSLSNLSGGLVKIGQIQETESQGLRMHEETNQNITQDNFHQSMACFLQKAEDKIGQLQKEEERVFLLVKDITEYFHGDCEKEEAHPIRIFVIVRDFLAILDKVCKEVGKMKQNFQTFAQRGSSMVSTHSSSRYLFPTALDSKPDCSGNESVSP